MEPCIISNNKIISSFSSIRQVDGSFCFLSSGQQVLLELWVTQQLRWPFRSGILPSIEVMSTVALYFKHLEQPFDFI
jgi:hypothetical protein